MGSNASACAAIRILRTALYLVLLFRLARFPASLDLYRLRDAGIFAASATALHALQRLMLWPPSTLRETAPQSGQMHRARIHARMLRAMEYSCAISRRTSNAAVSAANRFDVLLD